MSDFLQHECGIAMLRLKKPLQHYVDKYGTPFYGLNKMYLLMEKQHNRGQDGAGARAARAGGVRRGRAVAPSRHAQTHTKGRGVLRLE